MEIFQKSCDEHNSSDKKHKGQKKKKKTQTNKTPNKRANLTLHFGESSGRWLVTVAAARPPPDGGVSWTPS